MAHTIRRMVPIELPTPQHTTPQHNTTQHNTTQHNTTQHNTPLQHAASFLLQGCTVPGFNLSPHVWKLLLGRPELVNLTADLAEADPQLAQGLAGLRQLGGGVEELGLHFQAHDALGSTVGCLGGLHERIFPGRKAWEAAEAAWRVKGSCYSSSCGSQSAMLSRRSNQ